MKLKVVCETASLPPRQKDSPREALGELRRCWRMPRWIHNIIKQTTSMPTGPVIDNFPNGRLKLNN